MTVCTYDNPATMQRECWENGELLCSYSANLLLSKIEIPGEYFFFGANIGDWDPGKLIGDEKAMRNN